MNIIEMKGIVKKFGEVVANNNVDFSLKEGEIHALLGENGAGKSTLMKVLYGMYRMDEGEIRVRGKKVEISDPRAAIDLGIGMVHQHFMLIPQLTVTENIFLGMKEAGFFLKRDKLVQQVSEVSRQYGFKIDPEDYIWQLPVGVQQKVEILKILIRKARILILDEPTAVLTPQEVSELFDSLKKMTEEGYSIILITHKMDEVLNYCDRVTVMRDGKSISTVEIGEVTEESLAKMMVGREVFLGQANEKREKNYGRLLLEVRNLKVNSDKGLKAVNNISFGVREGEILGIAGVDGNGQLELGEALVGLRKFEGEIMIDGEKVSEADPCKLISMGIAHIPEDRHKRGLVLQFTISENLILGSQRSDKYCSGYFMSENSINKKSETLIKEYDVRPAIPGLTAESLSGGNQQKVVLARELSRNPKVIVAMQPTRGLDVGAIEFVRKRLLEEREKGKAVVFISTELEEILALSDKIAVIFDGEFVDIVSPDTGREKIGLMMTGKKSDRLKEGDKDE